MVKLMHRCKRLARAGAGVLILHHDAKYSESGWRGATGIIALSDMAIAAAKNKEKNLIELRTLRFRMCQDWELDFHIRFEESPPPDSNEPHYSITVDRDETAAEAVAQAKAAKQVVEEKQS